MPDGQQAEKITRRQFLGRAALATLFLSLPAWLTGSNANQGPESSAEKIGPPKMLLLDIFDSDKLIERQVKKIESESGKSKNELLAGMGISDPTTEAGLSSGLIENPFQGKLFAALALNNKYTDHGNIVNHIREKAAGRFGQGADLPLQRQTITPAISLRNVQFDDLRNFRAELYVDPRVIEELVRGSDADVVSMSFQLGKIPLHYRQYSEPQVLTPHESASGYYDSNNNPITKAEYELQLANPPKTESKPLDKNKRTISFVDGYSRELAYDNLSLLTNIADKFPEKTFVVAGGNPFLHNGLKIPNITAAKQRLVKEGKWRENIIVAGFEWQDSGFSGYSPEGADVYVGYDDLKNLAGDQASSYATPIVAEAVRKIKRTIKSAAEIAESLQAMCSTKTLTESENVIYRYQVLDLNKVAQ